jgi:hypothetical protein
MTLSDDVYTICSGYSGLTDLVSDRIYRSRQPASPTYPHVVYHVPIDDDNTAYRTQNETPERRVILAQFDCYGATANEADDVAAQVIALWDGYQSSDPDIGYAFKQNDIDDGYQAGLDAFRVIVDIRIETGE